MSNGEPLMPPAGTIYLGAHVSPAGSTSPAIVAAFESQIGRKLALDMHYRQWLQDFPTVDELDDASNGRVPVLLWNCGVPNAQVASGSQDAIIDQRAAAIKKYGMPLFLAYQFEMNLSDSSNSRAACYDPSTDLPNGYFSPTQYIAAWKHIRTRFAADGVTNVVWLWNPSAGGQNTTSYFPGSTQVDWVGVDNLDYSGQPFSTMFAKMYSVLTPLSKPILVTETGAQAAVQSSFLAGVIPALETTYPLVGGFIYYDVSGSPNDWSLSSGQAAFSTAAQDPYMSAFVVPSPNPSPTPTPKPAPLLPPAGHAYFGASVKPTATWSETGVESFEKAIGRTLAIDHHYYVWSTLAVSGYQWPAEDADASFGRIPLVNINCLHHNIDIINGVYDGEIINIANNVKAFGKPMFLDYWWEMNVDENSNNRTACYDSTRDGANGGVPNGFFSPSDFSAAWRHIHQIFVAQGVTNAVWVFNFDGTGGESPGLYYPGDGIVDWIGYDAYAKTLGESFAETNSRAYPRAVGISATKPIMVCETGVQQADNQQAWLTGVDAAMLSTYPNIRAWLYWDSQAAGGNYDFNTTGLSQFAILGAAPFFQT